MFIATFRIVFSSIQMLNVGVVLVVIHTNYCFGQIMLLSDRTIMGVRRYQTPSEDTIHPTEHYYWPVFIAFSRDLTIPHLDLSHFALCIMGN